MKVIRSPETTIVAPSRRVDATNAAELERVCRQEIQDGATDLTLDFRATEYISSTGLRAVLAIGKELQSQAGRLSLANLNDLVKEVFELSGFLGLFPVRPDAPLPQ